MAKIEFVPVTPGGSPLMHLVASTEEKAWENLMESDGRGLYETVGQYQKRGYSVEEWENVE